MRVLVVGSGGREHALAAKLAQSPMVDKIFVAPGNPGTAALAANVNLQANDIKGLVDFAKKESIDLVAPGPEQPLTMGICDAMREAGIKCFGPDQYCAQLEGSKIFAKEIMSAAGVPTAKYAEFDDVEAARAYLATMPETVVIKADGLAAGKGVVVADNHSEALEAIDAMLAQNKFGAAGSKIIIEERLQGEEVSLLCLCDGESVRPLPSAQDHKAAYDNDRGPNTGGMGAYSPAPVLPDAKLREIANLVVQPVVTEMKRRGHPFKGVIYAGLMMTAEGPKVLEYNVRFGDPECQPLMLRLESDLASLMLACVNGTLEKEEMVFTGKPALGVVLSAAGYPGAYAKGMVIEGIEKAEDENTRVFQSGTILDGNMLKAAGGRVLCVTALGDNLVEAQKNAYAALAKISMDKGAYRKDIGARGIKRIETMSKDSAS